MSDQSLEIDVAAWVERARQDPVAWRERQATEITLNAIAMAAPLNQKLYLKGGVLMGLAYNSPRQTADIDLTADIPMSADLDKTIRQLLDSTFPRAAAALGYADLVVKINSVRRQPKASHFETAEFPALQFKIGYAERGSSQERALLDGKAADVIEVDISFNEPTNSIQVLRLTGGEALRAYSLVDLIAEKYRAMLQQVTRNRYRRQDVYDLNLLIDDPEIDERCRIQMLQVFLEKSRSRHIEPSIDSLDEPEVKRRSSAEWDSLKLEIGDIPDFESCFNRVREFYRGLPWSA